MNGTVTQLECDYKQKQVVLVQQCVETAVTYASLIEIASNIIAELDVLVSFATAAALSPNVYTRPILHPIQTETKSKRILSLKNARHPCVELMDGVSFIPNMYELDTESAKLQLVTGPNMV